MCTLITLWKCHPSTPLLLALNRDEFLSRPTVAPAVWTPESSITPIISGRDLLSGGTWFGIGPKAVAGLTNHRSPQSRSHPGERSRGEIVVKALIKNNLDEAIEDLRNLDLAMFGKFHLLAADRNNMAWLTNRSGELEVSEVEPGVHVLGNFGMDNETDPVVATLHKALQGVEKLKEDELKKFLISTLSRHGPGWPCIHMGPYGTRSSALLWWGGENQKFFATDGPPCENQFKDLTPLLLNLLPPASEIMVGLP